MARYLFGGLLAATVSGIYFAPKLTKKFFLNTDPLPTTYNFELAKLEDELKNIVGDNVRLEELNLNVDKDTTLNLVKFKNPNTKNHIIVSHPNAENLTESFYLFNKFGSNASMTLYDYRGYGKSSGDPTEDGMYEDLRVVYDDVVQDNEPQHVTLFGVSFGSTIAAKVAKDLCDEDPTKTKIPKGMIMIGAFTSHPDFRNDFVINNICKFRPNVMKVVNRITTYLSEDLQLDTQKYVEEIGDQLPILVAHSTEDQIVDISHARTLNRVNDNTEYYELKGSHTKPTMDERFVDKVNEYLFE